jgi:hypothetical protein
VSANSGYWVVPSAAALEGPAGTMVAALVTIPHTVINMWWTALMRKDASICQSCSTGWTDNSPLLVAIAGFVLRTIRPTASSTSEVLTWVGPLFAFSSAALVSGSILHPHNQTITRTHESLWRWTRLTSLRVVYCLIILALITSRPLRVVALLTAFGAPSFSPVQLTVLYGYRSSVVNGAVR